MSSALANPANPGVKEGALPRDVDVPVKALFRAIL